jgi:hypothetical protein
LFDKDPFPRTVGITEKGTDTGTILTGEYGACKAVSAKTGQSLSGVNITPA